MSCLTNTHIYTHNTHTMQSTHAQTSTTTHNGIRTFVKFKLAFADLAEQFPLILLNKGRISAQQNVHNNPQGPHVGLRVVRGAFQNFRGHVPGCPTLRGEAGGPGASFGEPKVGNFDIRVIVVGLMNDMGDSVMMMMIMGECAALKSLIAKEAITGKHCGTESFFSHTTYQQEQVFGFQITVCHLFAVYVLHGFKQHHRGISGFLFVVVRLLHNAVKQFATHHFFRHQVVIVLFVKGIVQANDIGVIHFFEYVNFVHESCSVMVH